jgi:Spy/CpxP family protein refolding chaperone
MRSLKMMGWSLAVLGLWSAVAFGHPRWGMRAMGPGMLGDGAGALLPLVLRGVDLTPEQEARVQEIIDAHRPAFRTLVQQLRTTQDELAARLFMPGALQEVDLQPYVQRVAALREQLMQEGLKVALEVRAVLTPEQLARANEVRARMKALHTEMHNLLKSKE